MSNQCAGVVEDVINKPWRPIPAGRMTLAQASRSRWFLVPLCLALSFFNGALWPSAVLLIATWGYNDLGYHGHWLGKNVVNVVGYLAFEFGATAVSGRSSNPPPFYPYSHLMYTLTEKDHLVHRSAMQSLLVIGLIILTTVHAGDFPDIVGDRKLGRRTVPIVFPKIARPGLSASLGIWSLLGSISSWHASSTTSIGALSGLFVAWRFFVFRTTVDDETSCFLYNVSLLLSLCAFQSILKLSCPFRSG